jgi:NAD(P)-dependent dehydrogenase (short-subunit alcohol dehydrogenase family)
MSEFDGKAGLVTGAASGIGRASAIAFAELGAKVLVCDVNEEGGAETVQTIADAGGTAAFQRLDITDAGEVEATVAKTIELYGSLDFAHNNAGISGETAPITDYPIEMFERVVAVNLTGMFLCMKYELQHMTSIGKGVIVNTSSDSGLRPTPEVAGYISSKFGSVGLTQTAALENAKTGIRINAICPGLIQTPMTQHYLDGDLLPPGFIEAKVPIGRLGQPEEMAKAAVWLCSDAASYVTGLCMPVDGAMNIA